MRIHLGLSAWLLSFALSFPGSAAERENPFAEAQQSFVNALNSMDGIELAGGPFRIAEEHAFEGESGYFVLGPKHLIPRLDQRLSVQARKITLNSRTNSLAIAASAYATDGNARGADRRSIHATLVRQGFANERDEITVFDLGMIQIRRVAHLPILKIEISNEGESAIVLLGAQTWQGIPLYRVLFDRIRGEFELDTVRESFVTRRRHEVALRAPSIAPQTFFAEPGLQKADWATLLQNFAVVDLPASQILEATMSERLVTLYVDSERPILPQQWVMLEKLDGSWQIAKAVEFRAEFPRPGAWWTFLPLLPETAGGSRGFQTGSDIPESRQVAEIVPRLRGVGRLNALRLVGKNVRVRTIHDEWRGYDLEFAQVGGRWRLNMVSEWTQ
ncbi:MAG TPA: hypothetical protein VF773_04235 [Verrucomicrobiae bacterium]